LGNSVLSTGKYYNQTGIYTDTLQTGMGCDSIVTLHLLVNLPSDTILYDTVCQYNAYTQHGFNISASELQTAGTFGFSDTLSNAKGCDSVVILQLTVNHIDTIVFYDVVCPNNAYMQHGFNISASELQTAGTFEFRDTLSNAKACDSIIILKLTVRELLPLDVNLGNDTTICWLDSIKLNAKHIDATHYQWQDGSTGVTYTVYYDGQYWVIISNPCSQANDTINVSYLKELYFNLGNDTVFCQSDTIDIKLDVTSPYASYLWQDGSTSPVYIIEREGTYSVTVSNACMSVSKAIEITTKDCRVCKLVFPNIFTPIGSDGKRYVFCPFDDACSFEEFTLSIYDRWGMLVWEKHCKSPNCPNYDDSSWWNGTAKSGNQVSEGVYYWTVHARFSASSNLKPLIQNGSVTVVK
jgi:hypothetical protein